MEQSVEKDSLTRGGKGAYCVAFVEEWPVVRDLTREGMPRIGVRVVLT